MTLLPLLAALALSPMHVTLVFAGHRLGGGVEHAALVEAAAIWRPYCVSVGGLPSAPSNDLVLTVQFSAFADSETRWQGPLGAVTFGEDNAPGELVTVFVVRLLHMLERVRLRDVPAESWPRALRDQLLGRAIGRILAHEIGHVILRTKEHSGRGLMRAIQTAEELIEPTRRRYELDWPPAVIHHP